jgi:hypothetical protein
MTAYTDKDALKMKAPSIASNLLFASALLCVGSGWAASDSTLNSRQTLLENLRTMDFSNPGVLLTGEMRSGLNSSVLTRDDLTATEVGAATEGDFTVQARPTKDTRATVKFRIHQDWQKSHEEGISPFLFDWWSYDGRALNGKIVFNLGDMRVHYTPLTLETPQVDPLQEPEILAKRRQDVMSYRHLDGSLGRLLQGLNFSYDSGSLLGLDNLYYQGTFARLRNQAKKSAQRFYDVDAADRYLAAGRAGLEIMGVSLKGTYLNSFDREKSARNFFTGVTGDDSTLLESNTVISALGEVNVAKIAKMEGYKASIGLEYAMSNYNSALLRKGKTTKQVTLIDSLRVGVGDEDLITHAVTNRTVETDALIKEDVLDLDGRAMLATVEFAPSAEIAEASIKVRYVNNDEKFLSELAQSPVYYSAAAVLNSDALYDSSAAGLMLENMRSTTSENMYYVVYRNDPLTQVNLVSGNDDVVGYQYLYNNYKKAHTIRTGWVNTPMTGNELMSIRATDFDPSVNLSMPFGMATADRAGLLLDAEWLLIDAVLVEARFSTLKAAQAEVSYSDIGFGSSVDIGKLIGMNRKLVVNGAYETTTETDGYARKSSRMAAGGRVGIWKGLSFLGAYQLVSKDFGKVFPVTVEVKESLLLAGPEIRITEGSSLQLQYGLLSNELTLAGSSMTVDRTLMSADVRVKF